LLLPPGLDPGPVSIHLLSTQEGRKGFVLGSAITMALPPPAAAELLQAYSLQVGDGGTADQAEQRSALRDLLRDYSLCWRLLGGAQQAATSPAAAGDLPSEALGASGAGGSSASMPLPTTPQAQALLSQLLHYLSLCNMPACHALLAGCCCRDAYLPADSSAAATGTTPAKRPAAAAEGSAPKAAVAGAASAVIKAAHAATEAAAYAPGASEAEAAETANSEQAAEAEIASINPCVPALAPSSIPVLAPFSRKQEPASPAAPMATSGSASSPDPDAWPQWWPASWLHALAARTSHLAALSRDPGYSAWKLQQSGQVERPGWVVIVSAVTAVGIWLSGKHVLVANFGLGIPWVCWLAVFLLLYGAPIGTSTLLAVVGEPLMAGREVEVALAVARVVACLAAVCGWLPLPGPFRTLWGVATTTVVVHGVLWPWLQHVRRWAGAGQWGAGLVWRAGDGEVMLLSSCSVCPCLLVQVFGLFESQRCTSGDVMHVHVMQCRCTH
jgi:hypothetical protein